MTKKFSLLQAKIIFVLVNTFFSVSRLLKMEGAPKRVWRRASKTKNM